MSPIEAYVQFEGQSDQSYMEQKLAVKFAIRSIDKYLLQLGPRAATQTKNVLINGIPGSGKSYVAHYLNLYAQADRAFGTDYCLRFSFVILLS
jgi:hypothetical protein